MKGVEGHETTTRRSLKRIPPIRRSRRKRWRISATASSPTSRRSIPRTCANLFPQAPKIAPGLKLFALHAADGTPIMLTDTREAAVANAWSQELEAVSVH